MPEPTTTSESVQQVRDRVLKLARKIEALSDSDITPEKYFPEFLKLLTQAVGALAGAVWFVDRGRLSLACEMDLAGTGIATDPAKMQLNQRLLGEVIATGQATAYSPGDGAGPGQLPADYLIILAALQIGSECKGVIEIFHRPDSPQESRPGYLQFVEQMCGYASGYLARSQEAAAEDAPSEFWSKFEQLSLRMQRSLNVDELSAAVANDGRLLLECDRLSVAFTRGKLTTVKAISGQDSVNARANLVRSMTKLVSTVIETSEPITFSGEIDRLPPQIEKPLADYVQESGSRMIMAVPLFEPDPLVDRDDDSDARRGDSMRKRLPVGCLVVEQVAQKRAAANFDQRVQILADHLAAALSNARNHQRVFLLPLWEKMGRALEWFHGRRLAKTLGVLGFVTVLLGILAFIPLEYRVEAEGRLLPVVQQKVFAPWDGQVIKIHVDPDVDPNVKAGDILVELRNNELKAELLAARNELILKHEQSISIIAEIDNAVRKADRDEETRLQGKLAAMQIEARGITRQVKILEARNESLVVRAPISGVVTNFQLKQLLEDRPVRRGEVLVEIMDKTQQWHLELDVEEHRMGHVQQALERLAEDEKLDVEFILATSSESTYEGKLELISARAETSGERGNVVQMYVSTNAEEIPSRFIGAEVRAKINCGYRSSGYVLFGDVIEFVRKNLWL